MREDHAPLVLDELHVVHHLHLAAVHVEDCSANQMLVEQDPPRLVHERWV